MPRRLWQNWAKTLRCTCEVEKPASVPELQEIVRRATGSGKRLKRVRASGGRYSWSPLVPTDGVIVDMRRFRKIELLDESPARTAACPTDSAARRTRILEVGAGVTIGALDRFARAKRLTLVSPPLFLGPTVGGAVAVGCHGTGFATGNFCDQLHEIRLVGADGEERTVKRGEPAFPAAMVALGTLGIVTAVKLEVVPQFSVYVDKRYVPVDYVVEEFDDLVTSCEYPEILWFPFSRKAWLYLMDRSNSPPDPRWGWTRLVDRVSRVVERTAGNHLLPWAAGSAPRLTPLLLRFASELVHEASASVQPASDAFHFLKYYPKNLDLCYAVPVEHAREAWRRVIALIEEYTRAELYPVNLAVHCRFTAGSAAWLAPDYGRRTCYIEVATVKGTPDRLWQEFFRELEERWADLPEARPHWGKRFERYHELRTLYPRMDDFLRVRDEWDRDRVFLNSFLERDVFQLHVPAALPALRPPPPPAPPPPETPRAGPPPPG
jgi:FAD/FMN-containing dehydrogenase